MAANQKTRTQNSPILRFQQGTLILENWDPALQPEYFLWDPRSRNWRTKGIYYRDFIEWIEFKGIPFEDRAANFSSPQLKLRSKLVPRPYQKEGLAAWLKTGCRGSITLPTGAGKSFLALTAMEQISQSTLIVLPTLALMNQWHDLLTDAFGLEVGILGGGYHLLQEITVTTYDSAYLYIDQYGDRFAFIIFDEVHHLPSPTYSHIAEMSLAPYRLGLTATYQRPDGLHGMLERLVGPMVYRKTVEDLKGEHLAEYEIVRLKVELTPEEKARYEEYQTKYLTFLRDGDIRFYGPDMKRFLQQSAYEPAARRALLARNEARKISLGAQRKLEILESLLKQHYQDRVIVFTENNDLVYQISKEFLIPALTHKTSTKERKRILDKFRQGQYSIIITSKVLNEGVDVPEANVAIILSGSASPVEYLQRLGRILRKKTGKRALLYEVVTRRTKETNISYRRRKVHAAHRASPLPY
ncbi:MAG: DEAD/DEAH box helicase family protein [candidate division KSB1 bacterium]|nr:DEAD/DEAH box helicase family protein [candidate division KSB1 bacterium]